MFSFSFLTTGPSQAGSAGREFVLSFLKNYQPSYKPQLQLLITAVEDNAKVTVQTTVLNFKKVKTLSLGESVTVQIPSGCELNRKKKNLCSVIVRASADVSVAAYNHKARTSDTALIYPTTELGRDYYILTPTKHDGKEFSLTNSNKHNRVTIFVQGRLWYNGASYKKGSKFTVQLKPYETVIFESNYDLTGTRVVSQQPLAVFSGHTCTTILSSYCNHVYEQLLPVNKWGSKYIVPPFPMQTQYDAVFVTASRRTRLVVTAGIKYSVNLAAGKTRSLKTTQRHPLSLQANYGIQVIVFFSGAKKTVNRVTKTYDAFMLSALSTDQYCSHYSLKVLKGFENKALVVAPNSAVPKMKLDNKPLPRNIVWKHFPGRKYVWTEIDVNKGKVLSSSSVPFALYSVGYSHRNGYGSAGQCVLPGKMHA